MKLGSRKKRVFRDPRNSPESFNEGTLHIVWYEGCSAKRARSLIVTHPTVQTSSVEYVSTIGQPSDLIVFLELRETDGAGFGWVQEVAELHYGEDFPDKRGGDGFEFWHSGVGFGPSNVGLEEIVEAHETEDGANEPPEEAQEGEELEEKLREEKLRVAHRETHEIRALGIVLEENKCARDRERSEKLTRCAMLNRQMKKSLRLE
ncbi:hypothetical protein DEO72_LG2g5420 [Vigna unguiculata]|uniref:Uncharacterized protein n=1 Tax=Vigna unguiculata TaxID=3917 RepID=A0A4D6L958_VIGUN|nr:hypothetical protein DEO72_LG2g5420 [Vigna unguiculata]